MRSFIFLLLVWSAVGKVTKRESLVSRFSSNPVFLSHFGGDDIFQPKVHFFTDSVDYEDSDEEIVENPHFSTSSVSINEETHIFEDSAEDTKVEEDFKTLPVFEKTQDFKTEDTQTDPDDGTLIYLFKSLPNFDRNVIFKKEEKTVVDGSEFGVTHFFTSLPLFEANQKFKEVSEDSKTEANDLKISEPNEDSNVGEIHVFKSLPLFDVRQNFKEENKEEKNNSFTSVQEQQKEDFTSLAQSQDKQNEEVNDFRKLPHFEEANFQKLGNGRKRVRLLRRKKLPRPDAPPDFHGTEFGRRLKPKGVQTVADLPLEDSEASFSNKINSYGQSVSPKSS